MMKQSEDKKIEKLQTMIFTGILVAVFVLLIRLVWPDGVLFMVLLRTGTISM